MPGDDAPTSRSFYDAHCRLCPRLAAFLHQVKQDHPDFACLPVPPFGPLDAPLLVAGLAPGLKGANASGRPFTGDGAGPLLYGTLTDLGLAWRPEPLRIADHPSSIRADDGLQLHGCRISNAVKCLPPGNKPLPAEIRTCNRYIAAEISAMPRLQVIVALGRVAHDAVLLALGHKPAAARFAHAAEHRLGAYTLIDSYHCSRYNQNTGRLTAPMFRAVFERAVQLVS
ncbi:MAG: SPO1 DNA polymerase [Thiomonas sp. 20-64-5]|nr:MAG: SPO1 DNA polymerase [Thiomonas sp. 20-64-5]